MTTDDPRFEALRQRFLARCRDDATRLREQANMNRTALIEIAHRISGSAGTFGFPWLSEAAAGIENELMDDDREPYDAGAILLSELDKLQLD